MTITHDEREALRLSVLCPGPLGDDTPTVVAVREMRKFVDDSGAPELMARWELADREAAGLRGARGAWLDHGQVLTLWLLAARVGDPVNLNSMAKFLCWKMSEKARAELGVDIRDASDRVSRAMAVRERLKRSLNRFVKVLDPFPTDRKDIIVTKDEFTRLDALLTPEFKRVKTERLYTLGNELLMTTFKTLPEEVRSRWDGNVSVDSTFVKAVTTRGCFPRSEYHSLEARGGWYAKEGDHVVDDKVVRVAKDYKWGFAATTAVMNTNDPDRELTFPQLTLGLSFHRPSETPGLHAARAVRPIFESGLPTKHLAGDQAFGSTPKPEDFQEEVRAMGYTLLYIPNPTYRGKVLKQDGVPINDGTAYCPAYESQHGLVSATMPRSAKSDARTRGDDEQAIEDLADLTLKQKLEQRRPFQLQFNNKPQPDGSRQAMCPAMGPNPTVTCPLRRRDVTAETGKTGTLRPITRKMLPLADVRPAVCTNPGGTQVLSGETWTRHAQFLPYGSPEWGKAYGNPRQTVESSYSIVKKESGIALAQAHRRAPRGFAKANLFTILALVVANMKKIGSWMVRGIKVDARGRGPLRPDVLRRRDSTYGEERDWRRGQASPDKGMPPPPRPEEPAA